MPIHLRVRDIFMFFKSFERPLTNYLELHMIVLILRSTCALICRCVATVRWSHSAHLAGPKANNHGRAHEPGVGPQTLHCVCPVLQ